MALDFTPLRNAVARLGEGVQQYQSNPSDSLIRDGLIQRFEFTYDLSAKTLRRAIEATADIPEQVDQMTFPTLIRTASEQDLLLGSWIEWHGYRNMRNITAHTYDEAKARDVVERIPAFLEEARALLERLQQRSSK
jgi:nucleotidyltransferase substrate binding protein (TIGR01987 family)